MIRKAKLVAGGHRIYPSKESCYCSVVSEACSFLKHLNRMKARAADSGNALSYGKIHEKYYIIVGSEFGELEKVTYC